jgi:hypothetical protein
MTAKTADAANRTAEYDRSAQGLQALTTEWPAETACTPRYLPFGSSFLPRRGSFGGSMFAMESGVMS